MSSPELSHGSPCRQATLSGPTEEMWWARAPIATGPATALRVPGARSGIDCCLAISSKRSSYGLGSPAASSRVDHLPMVARGGRHGTVGCSEVLERVAVEPKMIRTPDLKIRSLGHTSGSGQTEKNSLRAYVFRFATELGHCPMQSALRIFAITRHSLLLDHLVCKGEQLRRYFEAKRPGRLEVQYELYAMLAEAVRNTG